MSSNWSPAGINNSGEYMVSGRPFLRYGQSFPSGWSTVGPLSADDQYDDVTNSAYVDFPFVTKRIIVKNRSAQTISIAFASLNLEDRTDAGKSAVKKQGNYVLLAQNEQLDLSVKVRRLFIASTDAGGAAAATVDIRAELTHITDNYDLTQASQQAADNYAAAGGRPDLIYMGIQGLAGIAENVKKT